MADFSAASAWKMVRLVRDGTGYWEMSPEGARRLADELIRAAERTESYLWRESQTAKAE